MLKKSKSTLNQQVGFETLPWPSESDPRMYFPFTKWVRFAFLWLTDGWRTAAQSETKYEWHSIHTTLFLHIQHYWLQASPQRRGFLSGANRRKWSTMKTNLLINSCAVELHISKWVNFPALQLIKNYQGSYFMEAILLIIPMSLTVQKLIQIFWTYFELGSELGAFQLYHIHGNIIRHRLVLKVSEPAVLFSQHEFGFPCHFHEFTREAVGPHSEKV